MVEIAETYADIKNVQQRTREEINRPSPQPRPSPAQEPKSELEKIREQAKTDPNVEVQERGDITVVRYYQTYRKSGRDVRRTTRTVFYRTGTEQKKRATIYTYNTKGDRQGTRKVNYETGAVSQRDESSGSGRRTGAAGQEITEPVSKTYDVTDASGKVWRSSNKEFLQEKTGVDVDKVTPGTTVLRDKKTGQVYYARKDVLSGQEVLIGVGKPAPEKVAPVSVKQRSPTPVTKKGYEGLTDATIKNIVTGKEELTPVGEPVGASFEYGTNVTAQPVGTYVPLFSEEEKKAIVKKAGVPRLGSKENPIVGGVVSAEPTREFNILGQEFTIKEGGFLISKGSREFEKAKEFASQGKPVETFGALAKGASFQFVGGLREGLQSAAENPVETAIELGLYAGAGVVAGGAGVALVFGTQNVLDVATGEEPRVLEIIENPVRSAGEIAPFIAAGGVVTGAKSFGSKARASIKTSLKNAELRRQGTIIASEGTALQYAEKGLNVELIGYEIQGFTGKGITAVDPRLSRFYYEIETKGRVGSVRGDQLRDFPEFFRVESTTRTKSIEPGLPGSQEGLITQPPRAETRVTKRGIARGELIEEASRIDGYYDFGVGETTRSLTAYEAEVKVSPLETTRDIPATTTKSPFSERPTFRKLVDDPNRLGYTPSLDYWEKAIIETPESITAVAKSFGTGKEVATTQAKTRLPFKVEKVKYTPKEKGTSSPTVADTSSFVDVESGGQVFRQEVKFSNEPLSKTETITDTLEEQQKEQEKKESERTKEEKTERESSFSIVKVQPLTSVKTGGRSFTERVSRLTPLTTTRRKTTDKIGIVPTLDLRQDTSAGELTTPETGTLPGVIISPITDVSTRQAQDNSLRTRQLTSLFDYKTPYRPPRRSPAEAESIGPPIISPKPSSKDKIRNNFDVQVRRRGRFQTVGKGLSFAEAVSKGRRVVERTAAASFRVPGSQTRKVSSLLPSTFRASTREPGVFIQRREERISSPGEKKDITKKGLFEIKKRRGKRRRNPWVL